MSDNSLQKRSSFRTRAKARYRRTSRDLTVGGDSTTTEMGKPKTDGVTKERKGKRERWLLTRKTWRYMADAGRKLIPDGALNRPDDVPKIEAYFQEVCHREPRFLLWRKQSYPGALGFRARGRSRGGRRKIGGSCRDKTSSADEADDLRQQQEREAQSSTQDSSTFKKVIRPSLLQLKQEFLFGRKESPPETIPSKDALVENVLCHFDDGTSSKALDHQELLDRLTAHLASIELKESQQSRSDSYSVDTTQKQLIDTMRRYYSKSTNRDKVISDILTDRKLLHKMYFELRRARGFSLGSSSGGSSSSTFDGGDGRSILKSRSRTAGMGTTNSGPSGWGGSGGAFRRAFNPSLSNFPSSSWKYSDFDEGDEENDEASPWSSPPQSDTPLSGDMDYGTQTDPITEQMMSSIDDEMRRQEEVQKAAAAAQEKEAQKTGGSGGSGRRSSLNHDDVSQSVSDTIKRYLRMARKKSMDSDKADRFKRINYDQTLRDIKAKPEDPISKDEDQDKGIQTDLSWVSAIKTLKLPYIQVEDTPPEVSSPPPASKSLLSSGQMFLSNLLHGLQHSSSSCSVVAAAGSMQKSKSSSSVVQQGTRLVARKVWKGRSKSQTRATPAATSTWTPQGNCVWTNVTGRSVTVEDTPLLQLTDLERRVLQKVALAKLQALNLGVAVRTPSETVSSTVQKPKRRAHLLKRKAITTGFFDTNRKDQEKKGDGSGLVFGIPLGQCVENERAVRLRSGSHEEPVTHQLRRESHHGSRTSFTSLIETPRCADERGSCESLIVSPTLSMPGLLDSLSCASTPDLTAPPPDGGVPNIVVTCLTHLESHGLHTLGLFRVSSSKKRVRQLREDFDSGKESTLDAESCPHDVATLLKEYFRDLPDALLCKDLYPAFIQTQRIRNRRLQQEALRNLIYLLPVANRDTLWALLNLLALVASNAEDHHSSDGEWRLGNKMDSNNLATLFAPNILHSCTSNKSLKDEMSAERVEERADAINVVRCLIDNFKQLYVVSAELMDEVYNHMMDSTPEALDTLLRRRDLQSDETVDDQELSMMSEDLSDRLVSSSHTQHDSDEQHQLTCAEEVRSGGSKERRIWSRGAFTHETAGMGGPDSEVKPRYKGRSRERITKKRREDGRRSDYDTGSNTPSSRRPSAHGLDTEYSSDQINSSRSSLESGAITAVLKIAVPSAASSSGVAGPFAVNLDDSDIPYIEDSHAHATADRQHISLSMVRTTSSSSAAAAGQQRTRSQSGGSDSSQASTTAATTYHHQMHHHYQAAPPPQSIYADSAIGSSHSAALGSPPPRITTPSSSGVYSSPPSSWASSTPPTSPTSPPPYSIMGPEDEPTTARISIPTTKKIITTTPDTRMSATPDNRQVILQRVTVKSTGELQHVKSSYIQSGATTPQLYLQSTPQVYVQPSTPSPQVYTSSTPQVYPQSSSSSSPQPAPRRRSGGAFQRLLSSGSTGSGGGGSSVSKSMSSSAIGGGGGGGGVERIIPILKESSSPAAVVDRKITTSISSIGGAVMRSKTADIERMINVSIVETKQPAAGAKKSSALVGGAASGGGGVGGDKGDDDKRKRRYTDVRHQTRHIPSDVGEGNSGGGVSSAGGGGTVGEQKRTVIWKRGQIISSEPKERRGFL